MVPTGVKSIQFGNIALVPYTKSNILSKYWIKKTGYQIIASNNGQYKFILWKHKLVFVAKAFNGAYYVQTQSEKERQRMCNATKEMPCKPLVLSDLGIIESLIKNWLVRLGHVHKESQ